MNSKAEYPRDSMTGLYRYDALPTLLTDVLSTDLDQRPESVAVLIVDVDGYKSILADCGTMAGNHFLREITSIILINVPRDSHVVRSGGAEFTIIVPQITREQASLIAEDLIRLVAAHTSRFKNSYEESPREMRGSITVGGVVVCNGNPDEMGTLLYWIAAIGYSALRQAKKYGYGRSKIERWMPPSQIARHLQDSHAQ